MGSFYKPNPNTVFVSITLQKLLQQKTTSPNLQHLKKHIQFFYCHVARNLANEKWGNVKVVKW